MNSRSLLCAALAAALSLNAPLYAAADAGRVATAGSALRLREQPSTSARVIASMPNGSGVEILGSRGGWFSVRFGADEGWASADYIDVLPTATPGPTAAPDATPTPSPDPTAMPDPTPSPDATAAPTGYRMVRTDGSSLRMRSGPGTGYERIASIPNGSRVIVTGSEGEWLNVVYDNGRTAVKGWVHGDYVTDLPAATPTPTPAPPATGMWRVVSGGSGLRMRAGHGSGYRVMTVIPDGATLRLYGSYGVWRQAEYVDGIITYKGWVHADYLVKV